MPLVSPQPQLAASVWPSVSDRASCAHCGDACGSAGITTSAGVFCCTGCESVYTLLHDRGLSAFYACDIPAGPSQRRTTDRDPARFAVLDDPIVRRRFVAEDDGRQARVVFTVPALHCASCVWLIERLGRVNDGIGSVEVDLLRHTATVVFRSDRIALSDVAGALADVGYEPLLSPEAPASVTPARRRLYTQIGVAGFAFGNIMLFSIPRYANGAPLEDGFQRLFDALNIALALPVLLYSASDFFRGAWQAIRRRTVTLDVPIVIGFTALFSRSLFDIATARGEGYLDSFAGLVFFLLIGRLFQHKAFDWIGFDRTFRSFFPLFVRVERADGGAATPIPIDRLRVGDRMTLRPQEVVPADSTLADERGSIDYAFLSGEREPIDVRRGDLVRAGGRIVGAPVRLDVAREVAHGELTALWNNPAHGRPRHYWLTDVSARFGGWFVAVALTLAAVGAVAWWPDAPRSLEVATAVLIIACPCAMTLAAPITLGTAMSMLGRRGWYLKDAAVVLDLSRVDTVIFDKTGTLTTAGQMAAATIEGLTTAETRLVASLAAGSVHPISRALAAHGDTSANVGARREIPGQGVRGRVEGHDVVIGSAAFVGSEIGVPPSSIDPGTIIAIDGRIRGRVRVTAPVRPGIERTIEQTSAEREVVLLSGDTSAEASRWAPLFGSNMAFGRTPEQKRTDVAERRARGRHVAMVGDGLNDAGAFDAANVGIAVSDHTACIVPACDVVVGGDRLAALPRVLDYARRARGVIVVCFVVSLFYNAIGLSLALAGLLSPLAAAILMPVSSLTIVGLSVGLTRLYARGLDLDQRSRRALRPAEPDGLKPASYAEQAL